MDPITANVTKEELVSSIQQAAVDLSQKQLTPDQHLRLERLEIKLWDLIDWVEDEKEALSKETVE